MRMAVSGIGRIGRSFIRALLSRDISNPDLHSLHDIEDGEALAYLIRYDSVRGTLPLPVVASKDKILIGMRSFQLIQCNKLPRWDRLGIDLVVDCTGTRISRVKASEHLDHGAKLVLVSAPVQDADRVIIFGYDHQLLTGTEKILSAASCTTNCLVPMLQAIELVVPIDYALMSTVHAYTAEQRLVDSPHRDLRRGRAAAMNIVPTTTGAARATQKILPKFAGRLDGRSFRVPVPDVSLVDLTVQLASPVTADEMNQQFIEVSRGSPVMEARQGPIVSSDILGSAASCTIDLDMTLAVGTLMKVVGWYDNEWGYANRMVDIVNHISLMAIYNEC